MTVEKLQNGSCVTLKAEGRIDATTAPELENAVSALPETISELIIDFERVTYISSAGLRVLLSAHKAMAEKGEMKITGVNADIAEIFNVTGFSGFLNIEQK